MEKELSDIGLGPDLAWHAAFRPGQAVDDTPIKDPVAAQRLATHRLPEKGHLNPVAWASHIFSALALPTPKTPPKVYTVVR